MPNSPRAPSSADPEGTRCEAVTAAAEVPESGAGARAGCIITVNFDSLNPAPCHACAHRSTCSPAAPEMSTVGMLTTAPVESMPMRSSDSCEARAVSWLLEQCAACTPASVPLRWCPPPAALPPPQLGRAVPWQRRSSGRAPPSRRAHGRVPRLSVAHTHREALPAPVTHSRLGHPAAATGVSHNQASDEESKRAPGRAPRAQTPQERQGRPSRPRPPRRHAL